MDTIILKNIDKVKCRRTKHIYYVCDKSFFLFSFSLILLLSVSNGIKAQYLKRSISDIQEISIDISTQTAHYKPILGVGDENSLNDKAINRYGNLIIDPFGNSNIIKNANEELIIFVLDGTGILHYDENKVPISKNDFMYLPVGTHFGISNPRERPLSVIIMGFKIFLGTDIKPTNQLMIANSDEVPLQVLPSHGPTTQFQLLMGTTESTRDRLSSTYQVTSLFIMDFAVSGTNIPHRHNKEEEIYFILRGHGDIVAGETIDGKEFRIHSKQGDVYFFPPKTLIGFYSGTKEGEEHARILAVRFKCVQQSQ